MVKNRCTIFLVLIMLCGVLGYLLAQPGMPTAAQEIVELKAIKNDGKPFVVKFYSPGCPHCQNFAPVFEQIANEHAQDTNFYSVDVNNIAAANTILKALTGDEVHTLPTTVLVNKGKASVVTGSMPYDSLQKHIMNNLNK